MTITIMTQFSWLELAYTIQKYMIIHDINQATKHDLQNLKLFKIINIRYMYVQSLLVMRST